MANSGGGIIVLGVQEDRATGVARELTTATLSALEEGHYRQAVFTRIHPPVQVVSWQPLSGPAEEDRAVVIHVPPSLDAPHLVYRDRTRMDEFVAPFRDGSHTRFMAERQLEAAYRQRFAGRTEQDNELHALYEDAATVFDPAVRACVVAVARPDQVRSSALGRARPGPRSGGLSEGTRPLAPTPVQRVDLRADRCGSAQSTARTAAAHSWGHSEPDDLKGRSGIVSLHDDGSISLCWTAGGFRDADPFDIYSFMVERTAVDLAVLVGATGRGLGIDSAYTLELGIAHPNDRPISVWHEADPHLSGARDRSAPIRRIKPVRVCRASRTRRRSSRPRETSLWIVFCRRESAASPRSECQQHDRRSRVDADC